MLPNLLRTPWASRAWGTTRTLLVAFLTATTLLLGTPLASASTPGSNGRIVYSADFGTEAQMFTIWGNGTGIRQITNEAGAAHVHPDWSPFGRRLAYELDTAEQAGISVARPDGIRFRTIHAKGFLGQPAFTADGRHILFSWFRGDGDQGIWVMRPDGTDKRRLTRSPFPDTGGDDDPNVSPDGKVVTFVRVRRVDELQALFAVYFDGTHLRQLTPYTFDVAIKHDWAPDGSRIVITTNANFSHAGESANIATVRPDGSDLRRVTNYSGGDVNAFAGSYSPDGRWIAYRFEDHGTFALAKIHPDGTERRIIRELPVPPRYIDWGPNL